MDLRRLALLGALIILPAMSAREQVILLHGLCRSPASMRKIERALTAEGYAVANLGYPSRREPIEALSVRVRAAIEAESKDFETVHVVTHSMGGLLIRHLQQQAPLEKLGRVVMLSPPNHGSEVADRLGGCLLYQWINGPAGAQLGTAEDALPRSLGPVEFELGVITGDRSINWILSTLIPGEDDGKVSVASARVEGMADFKVVHATHPLIVRKRAVIADVITFLRAGRFEVTSGPTRQRPRGSSARRGRAVRDRR